MIPIPPSECLAHIERSAAAAFHPVGRWTGTLASQPEERQKKQLPPFNSPPQGICSITNQLSMGIGLDWIGWVTCRSCHRRKLLIFLRLLLSCHCLHIVQLTLCVQLLYSPIISVVLQVQPKMILIYYLLHGQSTALGGSRYFLVI